MLTAEEAYKIAKKKYISPRLLACLDFGTFYLFSFAPFMENVEDGYLTGTTFDAVDKRTGRRFLYDVTSDIDAYDKAKEVKIKTVMDEIVNV